MTKKWIELELLSDSDARLPVIEGGRISLDETSVRSVTGYSDQMLGDGCILVLDTIAKNGGSRLIRVRDAFSEIKTQLSDLTEWIEVDIVNDSLGKLSSLQTVGLLRREGIKALSEVKDSFTGARSQLTLDTVGDHGVARALLLKQSYVDLKSALPWRSALVKHHQDA
ncbi:hypothetical protein ACIOWK_32370 [Pseudomonas protegens]|uniref:hypothetical protein n=1 Tax=Pseudomonas protegens TaxID=380021 RepID=UPI0038126EA0